ncbi:MAG TPA: hypothetical protein VK000_11315, partial [Luteimonas sp.]|nr:hypothetical protein [Luteimonas sp.]
APAARFLHGARAAAAQTIRSAPKSRAALKQAPVPAVHRDMEGPPQPLSDGPQPMRGRGMRLPVRSGRCRIRGAAGIGHPRRDRLALSTRAWHRASVLSWTKP